MQPIHPRVQNGNDDACSLGIVPCGRCANFGQMPGTAILGIVRHEIGLHKIVKFRKLKMRVMSQPCRNRLFRGVCGQIHNIQITLTDFPRLATVLPENFRQILFRKPGVRHNQYPPLRPGPATANSLPPALRLCSRRTKKQQSYKCSK